MQNTHIKIYFEYTIQKNSFTYSKSLKYLYFEYSLVLHECLNCVVIR